MTFCVGWRASDAIFLAADAAVTTAVTDGQTRHTSFGEVSFREPGRAVDEGALKIFRLGETALTFTGDAEIGYSLARQLAAQINTNQAPDEAFRRAACSIIAPPATPEICAIYGYYDDAAPVLLTFNAQSTGEIEPVSHVVQLGLRAPYRDQVDEMISSVEADIPAARDRLACVLGFCQSIGVRNYLLEEGVGGPFCGCFIDCTGFHWLPDISFFLYSGTPGPGESFEEGEGIISLVRDDIFFVGSPFTGGFHVWHNNGLQEWDPEYLVRTVNERSEEANQVVGDQRFDYSVLIGKDTAVTVIVRMDKHQSVRDLGHNLNRLRRSDRIMNVRSGMSAELGEILKGERRSATAHPEIPYVHFIPFRPT